MTKILSESELERISDYVNGVESVTNRTLSQIEVVLKSFNNEEIVNSFYASGKFGIKEKERLEQVSKAIKRYQDVINGGEDSLIPQTRSYIKRQQELLRNGKASDNGSRGTNTEYYN